MSFGDGAGAFPASVEYAPEGAGLLCTASDLDGDLCAEAVCASRFAGTLFVVAGNEAGLTAEVTEYAVEGPRAVAVTALGGDERPDVAVVSSGGDVRWFIASADGLQLMSESAPLTGIVGNGSKVFPFDIDDDGVDELVVNTSQAELVVGVGAQSSATRLGSTGMTDLIWIDVDGDGRTAAVFAENGLHWFGNGSTGP